MALPDGAWARWLGTLALGLGLAVGVAFGLVALGRRLAEASMTTWDEAALRWVVAHGPLSFDAGIWWESLGTSAVLIPLLVLGFVAAARAGRPLLALSFPVAYGGTKLLIYTAWAAWERARPTVVADGLAAPEGLASYPSGHVINVLAVYGLFVYLWTERATHWSERLFAALVLLTVTAVVGLARLSLGVHWPSDVIAGAVLGVAWLAALVVALRRGELFPHAQPIRPQTQPT